MFDGYCENIRQIFYNEPGQEVAGTRYEPSILFVIKWPSAVIIITKPAHHHFRQLSTLCVLV